MSATTQTAPAQAVPRRRYRVAGFWRRTGAGLIDLAIVLPLIALVRVVVGKLAPHDVPPLRSAGLDIAVQLFLEGSTAFLALVLLSVGIFLLYHTLFHGLMGATPGLRLCKARVVDVYGDAPSLTRAALRSFGFVAGALLLCWVLVRVASPEHRMVAPFAAVVLVMAGWLWAGFDRDKRGLHDWLAGTYVVRS
jgi:uncharacterized RDD family membrane protein YckC